MCAASEIRSASNEPAPPDIDAVERQLGRPPRGAWEVARRCACGLPQVIKTEPRLPDGTPFPTTWWLTCKRLNAAIGRLEETGWISKVNDRLASDPEFREALAEATGAYIHKRDELYPLGNDVHPGGGPQRIKCLHAHTADHLVNGNNPVGALVLEVLEWSEPGDPCVMTT